MNGATRFGLLAAVAVPVLYFGAQLAAAPFYPGYSFLSDAASLLGSDRSALPAVLNVGAFLTGTAALLASYGIAHGLSRAGAKRVWIWLVVLSVISTGASSIWASIFHLPDPRHNPGALGAGTFAGPLVFLLAFWSVRQASSMRIYLGINLVAFGLLAPILSGHAGIDLSHYGGLFQRFAAVVAYVPIAVAGSFLLRRAAGPRALNVQ
jgi:Protein of unknown function (DUF998)